jgi:4'-phosphopantetheinyl transferase
MDALRCLASEALLLHTAKVVWNFDPEALATVRGAHGKPAFVDHPDHHFNLSHSGPWILCALHNAPVGVDVEQESHRGAEAAEAFLSQDELRRHRQLPGDQRPADFFRLWTLKESLLKAAGTGLSHDPRTISISREGVLATAAPPAPSGTSWVLRPLPMPPGTRGACCFARGSARPAHPLG